LAKPPFIYALHIKTTPKKLWQALIDNRFIPKYFFGYKIRSEWKKGAKVEFIWPDGTSSDWGHVTRFQPNKVLAYTFGWPKDKTKRKRPTEVKFEILPMLGGVKLLVTHDHLMPADTDDNPMTLKGINNGWPACLSGLKSLLETGKGCLDFSLMDSYGKLKAKKG